MQLPYPCPFLKQNLNFWYLKYSSQLPRPGSDVITCMESQIHWNVYWNTYMNAFQRWVIKGCFYKKDNTKEKKSLHASSL